MDLPKAEFKQNPKESSNEKNLIDAKLLMRKNLRNRRDQIKGSVEVTSTKANRTEKDRLKTSTGARPKWTEHLNRSYGVGQIQGFQKGMPDSRHLADI